MEVVEYIIGAVFVLAVFGFIGWKVYQKYKANQIAIEKMEKWMKYMNEDGRGAP